VHAQVGCSEVGVAVERGGNAQRGLGGHG
jgi:hypothetical protein